MTQDSEPPCSGSPGETPFSLYRGHWWVAHTKPRQEKAFAQNCRSIGIPYYLPLQEKRIRRRDNNKIRKSTIPLFGGYVSIAPSENDLGSLYQHHRLLHMLEVVDQDTFIQELEQIRLVLASPAPFESLPAFVCGEKVRVCGGCLMGLEGEVIRAKSETIFVIKVEMFQTAVRVEIDEAYLERVQ